MNITLVRSGIPELMPMQRSGDPASHVSYIIRSLCIRMGHFKPSDPDAAPRQTLWELGSAFELAVIRGLAERYAMNDPHKYCSPGEMELDGLIGTMDLFELTPEPAVHEMKLTKLSANHDPESDKFWKYWVQLKAYCRMAEVQHGYLHVCHINGNYRDIPEVYNVWHCKFTKQELMENWRMLTSHAAELRLEAANASA